jgi:glutathione-specific gamma-glutamylcyclotransferase
LIDVSAGGDLWVFGYGSLMWRPGFEVVERSDATLTGWHRCFCITSTHHRGSPQRPGLVLGLDRGGQCQGVAYRVDAERKTDVLRYLRVRELVNGVYREVQVSVTLADGRNVVALAYVAERAHPSYAGRLPLRRQAFLIRGAKGLSGENLDYLVNTVVHLIRSGRREPDLERLVTIAAPFIAQRVARDGSGALVCASAVGIRRAVSGRSANVRRLPKAERRRFLYRMRLGA